MLTPQDIQSFQALYEKHFKETLTAAEAERQASALITLVRVVYGNLVKPDHGPVEKSTDRS